MAIKSFPNKAAYDAATKSTIESQVSMIETSRAIIVDGVNVVTTEPTVGDALFLDEQNNKVFVKGGEWLQKAIIPSAWVWVGTVFMREGRQVGVVHKTGGDEKYCDVLQYTLNAPTLDGQEHTASIGVRVAGGTSAGYDAYTTINYTYTATTLAEVCTALNAAIEAAQTELGFTNTLWAFLANANDEPDTDNPTKIIVQIDRWNSWQQTSCTGMTFSVWGDMPASTVYFKTNGLSTEFRGIVNIARGLAYWSTNGRTPSTNEPLHVGGNTDPVKESAFDTSEYCADIRTAYGDYENYLRQEFGVMFPQKYGTFALPDGKTLSDKYALKWAPTKAGGTKYKFPALYAAYNKSFGVDGLDFGDWFLPGCKEGVYLMRDETLALITPTITKMAGTAINNKTSRWFAQRYNANYARHFNGTRGNLDSDTVTYRHRVQAVTLLNI